MRRLRAALWLAAMLGGLASAAAALAGEATQPIVVVPIEGTVDDGMEHLVARSVEAANEQQSQNRESQFSA